MLFTFNTTSQGMLFSVRFWNYIFVTSCTKKTRTKKYLNLILFVLLVDFWFKKYVYSYEFYLKFYTLGENIFASVCIFR